MNTKLTLTIEQAVIEKAKQYARERGRSLSDLIENYLKSLIGPELPEQDKTTPTVKALKGTFKMPENFDYKKELSERLSDKYLL